MKMRAPLLALALVAATAAPALAETVEKTVEAGKAFPYLDKYYSLAPGERSLFVLRYNFRQDGKAPTDLKLSLGEGAKRAPIPLGADGKVERLPTAAELAAKTPLTITAPKGSKIGEQLNMDTSIKPAQEIEAAQCVAAIGQVNAAISRFAGLLTFAAPKIKACTFVGAGSGTAVMADGKTQPLPLIKGAPAYDPAAIKGAKTIRLAKTPTLVSME